MAGHSPGPDQPAQPKTLGTEGYTWPLRPHTRSTPLFGPAAVSAPWETPQLSQRLARPASTSQGQMPALAAETARPAHPQLLMLP